MDAQRTDAAAQPIVQRVPMRRWPEVLAGVILVIVDQASKSWISTHATLLPVEWHVAGCAITVSLNHNPGAFLSLGANLPDMIRRIVFTALPAAFVVGASFHYVRGHHRSTLVRVCVLLLAAGATGNLLDRVFNGGGYVVDFMHLACGPLQTGVFNVADMALTFAVLVIAVGGFILELSAPESETAQPPR
jgi:signal peptidase II